MSTKIAGSGYSTSGIQPETLKIMKDFGLSPRFGFAREFPLCQLPDYFQPWSEICTNLQELCKSRKVREEVEKLPLLDHNKLGNEKEWDLAHVMLAYITQGFVWQDGNEGVPEVLPTCVAVPFSAVADHVGVLPCFSNFAFALANWRLIDPAGPIGHGNMTTIVTLKGGKDEEWFFNTVSNVEFAFARAIPCIIEAQEAVKEGKEETVLSNLQKIQAAIQDMSSEFKRMNEGLDPAAFFTVIRPLLSGWNSDAFVKKGLKGLIYEGVSPEPVCHRAGTAAQSSTFQTFDAAFGVDHEKANIDITNVFRKYMPIKHQKFIERIEKGPSIRKFVLKCNNKDLTNTFNRCVDQMKELRSYHLNLVARNIITQARKAGQDADKEEVGGTRGTLLMPFLKELRNATTNASMSGEQKGKYSDLTTNWKIPVGAAVVVATVGIVVAVILSRQ